MIRYEMQDYYAECVQCFQFHGSIKALSADIFTVPFE